MIKEKICQLYQIIEELEAAYPGKHFTLDGVLMGNLGEVYAAEKYGLKLLPESTKTHDAVTADGKYVQIKVTQGKQIALYGEPDYLLVLQLQRDGAFVEVYYGSGKGPWEKSGKMQKNGQRHISLKKLQDCRS